MSNDDSDPELRKAIALSLCVDEPTLIDLVSSDDEDDDLDASTSVRNRKPLRSDLQSNHLTPNMSSMLGLDCYAMEAERLERLAQRTKPRRMVVEPRNQDSLPATRKRKREISVSSSNILDNHCTMHKQDSSTKTGSNDGKPALSSREMPGSNQGVQFPTGSVKRTWLKGQPMESDMITIEEVLQKEDLELAVLSSFQVDPAWVASKLLNHTKVIWVLGVRNEAEKMSIRHEAPEEYKFCFVPLDGVTRIHHSKLQLLAHASHLRVVVPSANLVAYDWGETGEMENVCFLIDLPRLAEGRTQDASSMPFGKELQRFLKALGLPDKVVQSLNRFDFSCTDKLRFIHSIGGSHGEESWKSTGYCGLGQAVRSLGLATASPIELDILASSIGILNNSFLEAIYLAAQGDNGTTEYEWRTGKHSKSNSSSVDAEHKLLVELNQRVRIHFPTRETVAASRGGCAAGGTICLSSKWYDSNQPPFPRHLMRDCKSTRNVLIHSKMIFVQLAKCLENVDMRSRAWGYVGSANLSESAW